MMDKHGIKSLDKLSSEEKKRFFNAVDKSYKAKNEETINENPAVIATAARMALKNRQGKDVSVNYARQPKYAKVDRTTHKRAKSLYQKIKDKISKKEKEKDKPETNISKSDSQKYADLYGGGAKVENVAPNHDGKAAPYGSGYEEMDEAKIQVQGIGMYDDKTLKKKIIQLATELQKNAKSGNWNKASENGIRALGRMWGAYQDYARNNESVNEDIDDSEKVRQLKAKRKKMKDRGASTSAINNITQLIQRAMEKRDEDLDIGHEDNEPDMLKKTSLEIMEYGKKLYDKLDYYDDMNNEVDFPTWWQAKLIISKEYLQKAYHYLDSEEKTDES